MPYKNKEKQLEFLVEWRKKHQGYFVKRRKDNPIADKKNKEYLRKWYRENKIKKSAHILVAEALRLGKLSIKSCEVCGKKAQAHHDDYLKPLDVRWLCRSHHMKHHALIKSMWKTPLV